MAKTHRIPWRQRLVLAMRAGVDVRTLTSVLDDPTTVQDNLSRARAAEVLRAEGILAAAPQPISRRTSRR